MKKIIYILLLAFASSMTMTACTEEEIKPSQSTAGGGGISDPK